MAESRDDFIIAIRSAFLKKSTKQKFSLLTLALFLLENNSEEKLYIPPKYDGEKVIPGFFDEKN